MERPMTPDKNYSELILGADYSTAGDDVQYTVMEDDSEKVVRLVFQRLVSGDRLVAQFQTSP